MSPLVCFPMKAEWERHQPPAEKDPYPAPVVSSREGFLPDIVPAPVEGLRRQAEFRGWATQLQYAQGFYPHATTGRPGETPKESFALRMARADEGAVAVYVGGSTWSWDYFYVWSPCRPWLKVETLSEFIDLLLGPMALFPSRTEWDAMEVCYPSKKEWRAIMKPRKKVAS